MCPQRDAGEWAIFELAVVYGVSETTARVTRFGERPEGPVETKAAVKCPSGLEVRIGSHLYGADGAQIGEYEVTVDDLVIDWN